jgi:regulatory protein
MMAGSGDAGEAGEACEAGDPVARAREICLRQLSTRARSRAELAATLGRRGIEPDVAEAVLERLTEVGLVDDEAFAAALVSSGRAHRRLGRRALAADLHRRGVDDDVSAVALAVVDPEDEEASARELIYQRLPSMDRLSPEARARRIAGLLARKGYPADVVARVVADVAGADPVNAEDMTDDGGVGASASCLGRGRVP